MSVHTQVKRTTIPQLMAYKGQRKIVSLTAHNSAFARIMDAYMDFILVGDSTAMVAYNHPNTLSITVEQMAAHGAAVVSATRHAAVLVDMPFGSYQESPEQAFRNAARILAVSGADGVKLEGGEALAPTVRFLVERGIPVMPHVGLMPQYVNTMGGFRAQGMNDAAAERILADARAHESAGAFGLVLEGIAEPLGRRITESVAIPTIGIGASPACDGQVLVTEDVLGLSGERVPKFVKRFADVETVMRGAFQSYAEEVREGVFPGPEHCFGIKPKEPRE
ncbi:3-methyl-2-oxobutanoate hydroxymethyltransferase [Orrella dioscoreae]|uniref:3-methyl-2-oxobutanoate hydroxymethyltransferase n=2 Tax=root TaxID=1 RepID=A0A1C3K6C8_9BURK|nr:3-methyl-2-oxobutanoate hydroxymethyltransferase [Orrella dioscoreae]SBT27091.1 3-methyl-2-oxobutanoate hydroxymethyltransferase [Orrella dioscoreae]SOE45909.1 3-methyl-2-oxobutanoate hydroxymethyltransferase [Orrella dioscoreae]